MNDPICITGLGAVSSFGYGVEALWQGLMKKQRALSPCVTIKTDLGHTYFVGEVNDADLPKQHPSRTTHLAMIATKEALKQAGNVSGKGACVIGTSVAGMRESEEAYQKSLKGEPVAREVILNHPSGKVSEDISKKYKLEGPTFTITTACSSGANAILQATELIKNGFCDWAIAGGSDALCRLAIDGFASLKVISKEESKPFDKKRDGLNLGEGAGIVVLEKESSALARKAKILGCYVSGSNTCDAYHGTAPHPEGRGIFKAVENAVSKVKGDINRIKYISAHGTGTLQNDEVEAKTMSSIFEGHSVKMSSIKGAIGHTLGAAGGIEAVVCIKSFLEETVPASIGLEDAENTTIDLITDKKSIQKKDWILSNSFAFGGNNTCLIFSGIAE